VVRCCVPVKNKKKVVPKSWLVLKDIINFCALPKWAIEKLFSFEIVNVQITKNMNLI